MAAAIRAAQKKERERARAQAAKRAAEQVEKTRGEKAAYDANVLAQKRRAALAKFMNAVFECDDDASALSVATVYSELLLSGVDAEGSTPLHKACAAGMFKLTEAILKRDDCAAAPSVRDNRGRTALHRAVTCDPTGQLCKALVQHPQCKIGARDIDGNTALDLAQDWGFLEAAAAIAEKQRQNRVAAKEAAMREKAAGDKELLKKQEQIVKRLGKDLVIKIQTSLQVTKSLGGFVKLFKKFDADNSGSLSADELIRLLRSEVKIREKDLSDDDIRAFVVALDDDKSGELDAKEIEEFIEHGSNKFFTDSDAAGFMAEVHAAEDKKLNDKQLKFVKLMGGIEVVNEIQRKLQRVMVKYRREGGVQALFDKYDKGRKGSLTADEFIKMLRREIGVKEKELSDRPIKFFTLALDDDGNQRLEPSELQDFIDRGVDTFFDGQDPTQTSIPSGLNKKQKRIIKTLGVQNVQSLQSKLKAATTDIGVNFIEIFQKFDDDGNGTMSPSELKTLIRKQLKIPPALLSDQKVDLFVEALDDDGTGELSAQEIEDFIERGAATFFAPPPKPPFRLAIHHTAGLEAVAEGRQEDALDLASYGGWPFLNEIDRKGNTMLHGAARKGWADVVKAILSREEFQVPDVINSERATALHVAAAGRHAEVCFEIIASNRFAAINLRELSGYTALHLAAIRGDQYTYDAILAHPDCDPSVPDYKGVSAPEYAIERGMEAVIPDILAEAPEL